MDRAKALKILRNFGHLMVELHSGIWRMANDPYIEIYENYLIEHTSGSLVQLSLVESTDFIFYNKLKRPFTNLKSLRFDFCSLYRQLPFNEFFPNLQSLKLTLSFQQLKPKPIKMHFSALTELALNDIERFDDNVLLELLQLNPQLIKLEIAFRDVFVPCVKENCPNLKHIGFYGENGLLKIRLLEPYNFDQIESLNLKDIDNMGIWLVFGKLQCLTIRSTEGNSEDIFNFIRNNPRLTSLKIDIRNNIELNDFFQLDNLLSSIEELKIRISREDIPVDGLMNFLTENRSLKKFSLIAPWKYFRHFVIAIISRHNEFEIRNKAIEFLVTKTIDQASMKFVLRLVTKGSDWKTDEEYEEMHVAGYNRNYDFENRLVECCTYNESSHLTAHKFDEYYEALRDKMAKIGSEPYAIDRTMSRFFY